jgi:hypothetical protein
VDGDGVPELVDALRLALGDVDRNHEIASLWVTTEPDRWTINYGGVGDDFGRGGFGIGRRDACEVLASIADQLRDHLGDDLDSTSWGPYCAVHDHPAVPLCVNGQARWCCPAQSDVWSAPIGSLGQPLTLIEESSGRRLRLRVSWERS